MNHTKNRTFLLYALSAFFLLASAAQSANKSCINERGHRKGYFAPVWKLLGLTRTIEKIDKKAPSTMAMVKLSGYVQNHGRNKTVKLVPLNKILLFHPMSFREAIVKTRKRAQALKEAKEEILIDNILTLENLRTVIPSKNDIQLVYDRENDFYFTVSGVGRISAIKEAFQDWEKIKIEVPVFDPPNKMTIPAIHTIRDILFNNAYEYGQRPE